MYVTTDKEHEFDIDQILGCSESAIIDDKNLSV